MDHQSESDDKDDARAMELQSESGKDDDAKSSTSSDDSKSSISNEAKSSSSDDAKTSSSSSDGGGDQEQITSSSSDGGDQEQNASSSDGGDQDQDDNSSSRPISELGENDEDTGREGGKGGWQDEEEKLILHYHETMGGDWRAISRKLIEKGYDRSPRSLQKRKHTIVRRLKRRVEKKMSGIFIEKLKNGCEPAIKKRRHNQHEGMPAFNRTGGSAYVAGRQVSSSGASAALSEQILRMAHQQRQMSSGIPRFSSPPATQNMSHFHPPAGHGMMHSSLPNAQAGGHLFQDHFPPQSPLSGAQERIQFGHNQPPSASAQQVAQLLQSLGQQHSLVGQQASRPPAPMVAQLLQSLGQQHSLIGQQASRPPAPMYHKRPMHGGASGIIPAAMALPSQHHSPMVDGALLAAAAALREERQQLLRQQHQLQQLQQLQQLLQQQHSQVEADHHQFQQPQRQNREQQNENRVLQQLQDLLHESGASIKNNTNTSNW